MRRKAEYVADALCVSGSCAITAGAAILCGVGVALIVAGVCMIGIGYLIDRASRGAGG